MTKLNHLLLAILVLTLWCKPISAQQYKVYYTVEDSLSHSNSQWLQEMFPSRVEALRYLGQLPALLQSKGYVTASIDSLSADTAMARVHLYMGNAFKWAHIHTRPENDELLQAIRWPEEALKGSFDFDALHLWQQKMLDYLESAGHPFARIYLDSISISGDEVKASLKIEKGPVYRIDSIRVYGDAKVNNDFLQRYLQIYNGSLYNKSKLLRISKKIAELNYVEETHTSDVTLLASGSVLNLYLKPRRSSQINALVGFAPNSAGDLNRKLLLTVDANILLRNALGSGETIGLVWQQLQQRSPQLNLIFQKPYAFHSQFGVDFSFDMYRRDSIYLNINMNLGTSYQLEERKTASIFLQRRQTIVNGLNTATILYTHKLPQEADVSSLNFGVGYNYAGTDYRFNPSRGDEWDITATAGNKKIMKNNQILELKDVNDTAFKFSHLYDTVQLSAYQFRMVVTGAHYFPLGHQSTFKLGLNAGLYQSGSYYRNELFQIGGYKLLRGFNEQSQYVSQYAIGTAEYRYRLGLNSFFFGFIDGGFGKHILEIQKNHSYLGAGMGLSFEIKSGVINLAWAVGKRDDTQFNLRESKVHVGFVSYF